MPPVEPAPAGVIHDLGYQRYTGPRLGRRYAALSLYMHSLRTAFGLGRSAKAKVFPWIVVGFTFVVAVVAVVVRSQTNMVFISYLQYPDNVGVPLLLFLAVVTPELVSRDLQTHVLPLYFSRPLHRIDYPLAKFAAFTVACLALLEIPLLLLYLGTITQVHGPGAIWSQTRALIPGLLIGLLWAVLLAAIGLLLASFSGRRAYATGAIAIYFFLSWVLAGILLAVSGGRGEAFGGPAVAGPGARLSGLASPFTTLDGVRQWLGGTSRGPIPDPGSYGAADGVMFLVLLAAAIGGLAVRYRKAGVA
jgi:ABC-2 type transport system permease protein